MLSSILGTVAIFGYFGDLSVFGAGFEVMAMLGFGLFFMAVGVIIDGCRKHYALRVLQFCDHDHTGLQRRIPDNRPGSHCYVRSSHIWAALHRNYDCDADGAVLSSSRAFEIYS